MRRLLVLVAAAWVGLFAERNGQACATAPHQGVAVRIDAEEALIVWDATQKTEHFVRRARFSTGDKPSDFGFLVPTPTKPTLAEVEDGIFDRLVALTQPRLERKEEMAFEPGLSCLVFLGRKASHEGVSVGVTVVDTQRVAGLDAAVLAADDAGELAKWLTDHGYPMRPALAEWLKHYVAQKWLVTAFKVAGDAVNVGTRAVRMTFATERPFYPYREPIEPSPSGSRALEIWFVAKDGPFGGSLGDAHESWPGALVWAHPSNVIGQFAFGSEGLGSGWLHHYVDASSPRPGRADLFFDKSTTGGEVEPKAVPVTTHRAVPVPLDLIALVVALVVWVARALGRRRAA